MASVEGHNSGQQEYKFEALTHCSHHSHTTACASLTILCLPEHCSSTSPSIYNMFSLRKVLIISLAFAIISEEVVGHSLLFHKIHLAKKLTFAKLHLGKKLALAKLHLVRPLAHLLVLKGLGLKLVAGKLVALGVGHGLLTRSGIGRNFGFRGYRQGFQQTSFQQSSTSYGQSSQGSVASQTPIRNSQSTRKS